MTLVQVIIGDTVTLLSFIETCHETCPSSVRHSKEQYDAGQPSGQFSGKGWTDNSLDQTPKKVPLWVANLAVDSLPLYEYTVIASIATGEPVKILQEDYWFGNSSWVGKVVKETKRIVLMIYLLI